MFFEKMFILAFEANSALSYENETKIVKITHSVLLPHAFRKLNFYDDSNHFLSLPNPNGWSAFAASSHRVICTFMS